MLKANIAVLLVSLSLTEHVLAQNIIKIGVSDSDGPPVAQFTDNNLSSGLTMDIGNLLAKELEAKPIFVVISRKRIEWALEQGKVDLVCNANPDWYGNSSQLKWTHAYRWLEEQRRVVARARSGFFAAAPVFPLSGEQTEVLPSPSTWVHIDDRVANLLSLSSSALNVQLHMADADQSLYPATELARRLQHKLQRDPALLGAYLPLQAEKQLKAEMLKLSASYQLSLNPDQILMF